MGRPAPLPQDRGQAAPGAALIEGARVILDDRVEVVSVRIEGGLITGIDTARDGARRIDARGLFLGPGMVDVHGDAFERQLAPRPGVLFPVEAALLETDRQLAANGITTGYHALTLSWEPGLRGLDVAGQVIRALADLQPRLTAGNRLQLRWETFCGGAEDLIRAALGAQDLPSLAFNDHTSTSVLDPSVAVQDRPAGLGADYPVADLASPGFLRKMEPHARRAGMSVAAYADAVRSHWEKRAEVPARIARVAAMGRKAGVPMLSHDDSQPETRTHFRALGARIAEFPMHERVLVAAREAGDVIVLGAPNAMRGGSHLGSPGAAQMVARGLCDVLASDYWHPAMLGAVARLLADGAAPLPRLWRLVAANPAAAMGLRDRGHIAPGQRADLVLIDWPEGGTPAVRRTWVAGRGGYAAMVTQC